MPFLFLAFNVIYWLSYGSQFIWTKEDGILTIVVGRLYCAVIYKPEVKMGDDAKPKLKMTVKKVLISRETSSVIRDLETFDLVCEGAQ